MDQIDAVRKSANELLIMASKLMVPSTIPLSRKRLASTRDNPAVSTAVVQSGGSESVGKMMSLFQNGVDNFVVGGTPSQMPPAPPVNASSTCNAQENNKSPVSWISENYTVTLYIY